MILDGLLSFNTVGTPQAITATAVSDNIIDLLNPRDMGIGDDPALKLALYVTTAFVSAGGATLQVQFQGAPNSSGSPGTYVVYAESRAYAVADLIQGVKVLPIDLPHRDPTLLVTFPRFYRINYVVAVSTFSAGAIDAKLVLDRQDSPQYPAGLTITN